MKMHRFTQAAVALALFVLTALPVAAQTALTSTTTAAIVSTTNQNIISVTSATGITAPGTGSTFVYLLIDKELMGVRSVTSTNVSVTRGQNGTRATTHITGATIYVVPATAVFNYVPSGQCTRTTIPYVPMVVGGSDEQSLNGTTFDCLGVTTAGQWTATNALGPIIFGTTVASASTITATGTYFKVSGTTAVVTINVPAGAAPGFMLTIEATGVLTWTAAGNILTAGTYTAAGHTVTFYWNGTKWVPDKVA